MLAVAFSFSLAALSHTGLEGAHHVTPPSARLCILKYQDSHKCLHHIRMVSYQLRLPSCQIYLTKFVPTMLVAIGVLAISLTFMFAECIPTLRSRNIDCGQFLPPVEQSKVGANFQCASIQTDRPKISGINIEMYHYTDGWIASDHILSIKQALLRVLPDYSKYCPQFDLKLILVEDIGGIYGEVETKAVIPHNPCFVLIEDAWNEDFSPDANQWQRTTAHELYHCVQDRNIMQNDPGNNLEKSGCWWFEGGASYFSSYYYPEPPDFAEKDTFNSYNPSVPLYNEGYPAQLFFLSLSNQGMSNSDINVFIKSQSITPSPEAERQRLSTDVVVRSAFPRFVQAFKDQTITFHNKAPAKVLPEFVLVPETENFQFTSDGQQEKRFFSFYPFTMKSYDVVLASTGVTYTIGYTTTDQYITLFYRPQSELDWVQLRSGESITAKIDCSAENMKYEFLMTSTDNVDRAGVFITFTRASHEDCMCKRDSSCPTSLDPCLYGNWVLDLPSFRNAIAAAEAKLSASITVSNIVVGGASTFSIAPATSISTMAFDNTTVSYDAAGGGYEFHTDVDITGRATGTVVMDGIHTFHWIDVQSSGTAKTVTKIKGEDTPVNIDLPLGNQYPQDLEVNYVCTAKLLTMTGVTGGNYTWAYSYNKAA
jgi:hypothetical protein